MDLLQDFTKEIEQEIQSMNSVDELLAHLVKTETIKWNRIRDYLIMKRYAKYRNGLLEYKNTHAFIEDMSSKLDCSPETVKNVIYGREKVIRSMG